MKRDNKYLCPYCRHVYDPLVHWLVCPNCGHETEVDEITLQQLYF